MFLASGTTNMKQITALNDQEGVQEEFVQPVTVLPQDNKLENFKIAKKIIKFEDIYQVLSLELLNKTVVQCHGVFDLLHIGHIKHLHHAKSIGDILVVTITADIFVNKGPGKPYFSEYLRAEALAALSCVD